jgi:hypothetical protein
MKTETAQNPIRAPAKNFFPSLSFRGTPEGEGRKVSFFYLL